LTQSLNCKQSLEYQLKKHPSTTTSTTRKRLFRDQFLATKWNSY